MEEVEFKIKQFSESAFKNSLQNIVKEEKIRWNQLEFQRDGTFVTVSIPKSANDKMSQEGLEELNSYTV